jgi:alkaline phosphatase
MCRLTVCLLFGLSTALLAQGGRARNVVLFLADAGGIPTVNAASWHGYNEPRKLFIQRMPNIGLSDTSPVRALVSDSAAGMTAIVTGEKTLNGVIGMDGSGERGKTDGKPLKTILEYAEERGLATGIITNDALTGATPASLYAKANDRASTAVIFQQVFTPRFGDISSTPDRFLRRIPARSSSSRRVPRIRRSPCNSSVRSRKRCATPR